MSLAVPRKKPVLPIVLDTTSTGEAPRRTFEVRSFLASLGVHLLLIAFLACMVFEPAGHLAVEAIFATLDHGGPDDATFDGMENQPEPVAKIELPADASPLEATEVAAVMRTLDAVASGPEFDENLSPEPSGSPSDRPVGEPGDGEANGEAGMTGPKITAGRSGERKSQLIKKFGGTVETEAAVELGLKWLAKQQMKDGGWSFAGPYSDPATFTENRVSATSMALLAFLGAGHTHKQGDYQRQINQALHWLVARQKASTGNFGGGTPPLHAFYTHAQATIVVCEAYAMTVDPWLKPYCSKAIDFAVRAQGPAGGWRYEFRGDSDTSVTGWFVMALVSGRSARVEIPEKTLKKINGFLDQVAQADGALYSYTPGRPSIPSMTAEGLLCRMYLGWPRDNPAIDRGAQRLLQVAPLRVQTGEYYYWYYVTQVMHHVGGEAWDEWNDQLKVQLPSVQVKAGPETGSWPTASGRHDHAGGRLYATCMAIYSLEVYYRHLPIYESPWDDDADVAQP